MFRLLIEQAIDVTNKIHVPNLKQTCTSWPVVDMYMGRDTTCNYVSSGLKNKSVLGVNSWRVPKQHGISRARGLN